MVDDDDDDRFPSLEPLTDSRSALPRELRASRRLRIVKRDDFFSLSFFSPKANIELELASEGQQGAHEVGARPRGARPPPSWKGCGPPGLHIWRGFFIVFSMTSRGVSGSAHKTTSW